MSCVYTCDGEGVFTVKCDDPENEDPFFGGEHGLAFVCDYDNEFEVRTVIDLAVNNAKKTLPAGTVFDIRTKLGKSTRNFGVAWYSLVNKASGFQDQAEVPLNLDYKNAPQDPIIGCKVLGVLRTPYDVSK